jgi:hypothetical protein
MFSFSSEGDWATTTKFLQKMRDFQIDSVLNAAGAKGAAALGSATPKDTGRAALSWTYEIKKSASSVEIGWKNTDVEGGFPVALMIQYGHGTGTGGYVTGRDFINPAIRPVFDEIAETVWKAVTSA